MFKQNLNKWKHTGKFLWPQQHGVKDNEQKLSTTEMERRNNNPKESGPL